jgi:gliding motility-associated-like protein
MGSTNGSTAVNTWTNGANSISVQFTQPGNYCITLQVGNTACGTDEVVQCVCIEAPPVPAFTLTPATGCAPFTGVVTNTSTSANSCLTTFGWNVTTSGGACGSGPAWNTVGGTSTSSFEPQFQFTQAGNYAIQLQAQNSCGTFLGTMNVVANAPPQVDVSGLAGICATQCVNPSAVVQNCGTPISTYAWTFPGGAPANSNLALPPQVCYANATSSAISLTVTNACGSATDVTTLAVGSLPTMPVISSNSPVCAGQTLSLTASTLPGMTYAWTGPNGFTSNMPSVTIPNASAANAGTYSVVAISSGCSGPAATVNVQVNAAPTITVTPSSAAICNGQSASFTASGAGNYQWFIGSTLVGTGPLFNTSPAISTAFTVSGSSGGCPGSTTVPVTVFPVTNVNAGPDQTFCDQAIGVQLGAFPSLGTWSGANVSPSGVFTPVPGQLGPVTLTYTHVDGNGCPNSDQVVISVQALTQIAYAGPDTFFCQSNTPVILPASPPGGSWIGAGGNGAFTPGVAGSFTATYFYGTGTCVTSDVVQIQVLPVPQLVMPANFARCLNAAPVPLSASPTGGVWSGPGVSGPPFFFDPAGVGVGLYAPAYTYTDGSGCTSTGQILVTVDPIPVVNAGPDMTLCDQPVPVQLIGTPAGGTWTGNTLPITPDGIFVPTGIGSDVFTYTFTNAAGCSGSDQAAVSIVAIDQPAYAGNDTSVCVNSGTLQLAGLPFGGVWSGPQVSTGGAFNTTVAGQFTLTYSYGSATCLVQDQVSVVVNALPVVDAGEEIATCLDGGLQVLIATPAGGTWTGAGVDATGIFDPLLAMPGGNPVTYTYTDPLSGCTNNAVALVTVNPLPTAAFSNDPVGCVNSAFPFTNTSAGASTFEWAFGDGSVSAGVSPTHTYFSESIFTVQLIAVSGAGCRDTITGVVDVRSVPQADLALSIDTGCGPLEVAFTNNSIGQGLSFAWNFGGLDSSTDVDPQPYLFPPDPVQGVTYPITLTATNSCGVDVALSSVTVIPPPTALFGPNVNSYCSFADVPFGNASFGSPEDFLWDFGNGTTSTDPGPVVTQAYEAVDVPLVINVTLTASNQCGSDMAVQSVTILPNQVNAFFNADPINGCSPVTVELTQFSTGDTTYYWDLGDGNVSTQHDLTHTYIQPGTYTIELFAYGCGFDSYSTEITVFPSPEVAFSISPPSACAGVPFNFLSTTPDVAGLQWDFGDGTGSTLTAPQHTYSQGGLFPVTLTATLIGNGCQASLTQQVLVNTAPLAAFGTLPVSGCVPLDVAFQNSSVGSDINQWSFGDGNTSVLPSPFHTYTTAGSFTIQLVAENLSGCTDTAYTTVVAHPLPTSAFTLSQYETCDTLATVQTMNASQGASGFSWDLGNGATSTLNQPMATYSAPGTYTIVLTAVNQYGCEAESSGTFVQYPAPVAQFSSSPQPGCAGYPVEFLNTSLHGTGFLWDLGDGATTTATFPMHTYATAGTYPVQLIVHGAGGCSDTLAVPGAVIIHPRPLAAYTTDTVASIPHAMHFRNQSEGAISFTWDFDDGDGSTAIHPLHVFPADGGGFTVCLVAVNEFGCPDTVCSYINLPGDPGIFAPNAFTPNGDTRNDVFLPILNGFVGWNYRLLVFDRWGLPAFDTRSRSEGWDGTRNGAESPVDVYVWKVIVERDGDARDFVGHVTLLR